jgi:hypothetical protein
MILLEQHAEQLVSRDRNDQQNGASHANHKQPAQHMGDNLGQEVKHISHPEHVGGILTATQIS